MRVGLVRIDYLNKAFLYNAGDLEVNVGDMVVIETDFGLDTGVIIEEVDDLDKGADPPAHKILRAATPEDIAKVESMAEREDEAFQVCHEEINKAGLKMKLINARFSFDASKVTFCYTAESRVDFRQLVRSLASRLRTRIELRQVGVRDEARLFGGVGQCGRPLCCATFLTGFEPVSIRMAKEQGLPLNPLKISGICGRLFCCLKYEYDYYKEVRRRMPNVGSKIEHDGKQLRVLNVMPLIMSVLAEDEEGSRSTVKLEIKFDPPEKPACNGECAGKGKNGNDNGAQDDDDGSDDAEPVPAAENTEDSDS